MNVPPLKQTVQKFLQSVKPILSSNDYDKIEIEAKVFFPNHEIKVIYYYIILILVDIFNYYKKLRFGLD